MDSRPRIVVVGSSNTDMTARAPRLPAPGETVLGGDFAMTGGGKGANQAVAAARLGARVTFIARIGKDVFGDNALAAFDAEGIDTRFIVRDETAPSGIALIGVDETTGENSIIVASGANANLSVDDIENARSVIEAAQVLICQLETPIETVSAALKIAHDTGVKTILNPAPAQTLPAEMLANIDVLTPNETEARQILGVTSDIEVWDLPEQLLAIGLTEVVVTFGSDGVLLVNCHNKQGSTSNGFPVKVVDTTAAGDCFTGALAVAIGEGTPMFDAVEFANRTAALSVTKAGAQPSLPTRAEVENLLEIVRRRVEFWATWFRMIEDADWRVRREAWEALGDSGISDDDEYIENAKELAERESDPEVAKSAQLALDLVLGPEWNMEIN